MRLLLPQYAVAAAVVRRASAHCARQSGQAGRSGACERSLGRMLKAGRPGAVPVGTSAYYVVNTS